MKVFYVLVAVCLSLSSFGQKGEYLIKNTGDTLWGEIKLQNKIFYVSGNNSAEVRGEDVTFVNSKSFKGNTVVRCKLQVYTDNLAYLELDFIEKSTVDTIMVLKEVYSTPKMNLYYAVDDSKVPFYFYKTPKDAKPVQLVIRYYLQGGLANYTDDRQRYRGDKSLVNIVEDKGYVNQLYFIMKDCKKITQPMWELLSYRSYSLKQLIKKFNKCK